MQTNSNLMNLQDFLNLRKMKAQAKTSATQIKFDKANPGRRKGSYVEFMKAVQFWEFFRNGKKIYNYELFWNGYDPTILMEDGYIGITKKEREYVFDKNDSK